MKFFKDVSVLTLSKFLVAVLNLSQGILVARWLGPKQFGVVALIISYPRFLFGLLDARSNAATVKYVSQFSARGENKRALAMCKLGYAVDFAIAAVVLLLVMITSAWAGQKVVHDPSVSYLLVFYSFFFLPFSFASTSKGMLSVWGRFDILAWGELASAAVSLVMVSALVLSGWGVAGAVVGKGIGMAALGLFLLIRSYGLTTKRWGSSWLAASWRELSGTGKEIFHFLLMTDLTEVVSLLGKQMDMLVLGFFAGPLSAGYYRLAKSFAGITDYLVQPIQQVIYPRLARLWGAGRQGEFFGTVRRLVLFITLPAGGAALLCLPALPAVISLFAGKDYAPAAFAAQLLFVNAALWLAFSWLRPVFFSLGEVSFILKNAAFVNLMCFLGFVMAAPRWSHTGLAWVVLISAGVAGNLIGLIYFLSLLRRRRISRAVDPTAGARLSCEVGS